MISKLLSNIDRRIIYIVLLVAIGFPIATGWTVKPARLPAGEKLFKVVESINTEKPSLSLIAMDFGPGTHAENQPQTEVIVEHLLRKRLRFAVFSIVAISEPFLNTIPEHVIKRLMKENANEKWEYGVDWVNLGYKPGGELFIQALARSDNLAEFFKKDAFGNELERLAIFKGIGGFKDIPFVGEFTGLVGAFGAYVQFMQRKDHIPKLGHGCTSITIPESYIYLDSGQLSGLIEGISGAAWYSELLKEKNPSRLPDSALVSNTALGIAQLAIIVLIVIGNLGMFLSMRAK